MENLSKILFLTNGDRDIVRAGVYKENIFAEPTYRSENRYIRGIGRTISDKVPFAGKIIYNNWAHNLEDYSIIICEGLVGKKNVFTYLLKNAPYSTRIIMWHWNKIFYNEIDPLSDFARQFEQWSFDPDDCKKYDMRFNSQYFGYSGSLDADSDMNNSVLFVGTDKDRGLLLNSFERLFHVVGLATDFVVVDGAIHRGHVRLYNGTYSKPITYNENIERAKKCNVILDLPMDGQRGLTLRVLEGLYLKKKVITTNPNVIKSGFYNENNIFILDNVDYDTGEIYDWPAMIKKLKHFVYNRYIDTEECARARDYYSFESWASRFRE